MIKALIIPLFVLFQLNVFGQKNTVQLDVLLFNKGLLLQQLVENELQLNKVIRDTNRTVEEKEFAVDVKETLLEEALGYYEELLTDYPKSNLRYRTLNNKGLIELELEDTLMAIESFKALLNSNADDREKGGRGSGIMADPYTNYKNSAAKTLAVIYINEGSFTEAIQFIDLTKKYPYQHFCGNAYASDEIYTCWLYTTCYIGLNEFDKAEVLLVPFLFENGLADNSVLVEMCYETLLKSHSKEEMRAEYERAFKNVETKKVKSRRDEIDVYYITFFGYEIILNSITDLWGSEFMQEEIDRVYKESAFYKLVNE